MNQPQPVPRQADLLVVTSGTQAALLRLQEEHARYLVKVPLGGKTAPDLLNQVLRQFALPSTYARIFVIGPGLDIGGQVVPVIELPWVAFRAASSALEDHEEGSL